mmetsp:Transcript_19209/g.29997  ORF Transcript_19209/g.29997 Transcript_19209/m.29997 type:complete len:81 (-) Transcript_19209:675-917(-)
MVVTIGICSESCGHAQASQFLASVLLPRVQHLKQQASRALLSAVTIRFLVISSRGAEEVEDIGECVSAGYLKNSLIAERP